MTDARPDCARQVVSEPDAGLEGRLAAAVGMRTRGELSCALAEFESVACGSGPLELVLRAMLERASTLVSMGRLEEALEACRSIEREHPSERAACASARNQVGMVLRMLRRYGEALEAFGSVERDFPDVREQCAMSRMYRGGTLRALGRFPEALELLRSIGRDFQDLRTLCAMARLVEAQTLRGAGELEVALEKFSSLDLDFPDARDERAWGRHELARTLNALGRRAEAQRARLSVAQDFPDRPGRAARALTMAGLHEPEPVLAREHLRRAAAYGDWLRWSAPARLLLGEISWEDFTKLMFDWRWRADVEYWMGELALRDGREGDSRKHFECSIELNVPGYTWPEFDAKLRLSRASALTR